ncbi:hypothetical protein GOODEAATRI_010818 [Goodea atripinnis]|uniref:Uncharacterized protein n=1 Tax=Goodea atripinnis TaxID=208336 RepID=A0ABV0PXI2_9TELE
MVPETPVMDRRIKTTTKQILGRILVSKIQQIMYIGTERYVIPRQSPNPVTLAGLEKGFFTFNLTELEQFSKEEWAKISISRCANPVEVVL